MLQGIGQGFNGERVTVVNLVPIDYIIQAAASLHYIRGFRKNLVRLVVYERFSHELFKKSSQALLSIRPGILRSGIESLL